ncbi:MAG: tRNA (5-methylaminomethyl-2-thiouridine)(34)-methyltransferase MnmD [Bacteroidales bacterium]|nr:tRNA (5-methylaminomethyl-2-thiouridine)(34)-methyltransferase MnmD [Bacteroidales bacterium]
MKRQIKKTGDGSHTLYVPELNEHYHSIHGAVMESKHIFIEAGFNSSSPDTVKVLEFGMGTGLNVLLTFLECAKSGRKVYYHAIEKYPVSEKEAEKLNLEGFTGSGSEGILDQIHRSPWNHTANISESFTLYKELNDFRKADPGQGYHVIYFDAFAPEVQPELWTADIFRRIWKMAETGAVLTTYSSKGQVKRNLVEAGFSVEKIPGPPGKREFIRATKP